MAIYQNSTSNLGVKLEITHASPDIANNRTTITYKASIFKTGSHNPYNLLSGTPMYLTINGQPLHSTATGNYDLRGGTYQQVIKTGTLTIPHNSDGTKSFTFSWNVNFTSTGYGYGNVTTSGTYVLPNIARASTFTIPSTTITTGSAFTVTINKASDGFRHKVAYIVGSSKNEWTTNANTSYSATIPHSLFNAHKSTDIVAGVIRVTTMNGSVEVGSNQTAVTINLASSAIPSLAGVSYTNSNKGMFTGTNQFIRNVSLPTITAGTAKGSYSSTISSYEFQTLRGGKVLETVSKTANSQQFGAFNFPNSGSEAKIYMQARVRDSRGRYSGWVKTAELRVHHYAPPAIGTMTVRRTGSGNTTLQVNRNYVVTSMFEGGGTTNSNTASLRFQHRTKGATLATQNNGAKSTTMYLTNSNANLEGTFATNTSYEVRAILSDKLNTVFGSWISVGTEFVPMDIGPMGVGVGKIHNSATYNLDVGSGGIRSDGNINADGSITGSRIDSNGSIRSKGTVIEQGRHYNFKSFTVGGTANNYYPVIISPQATFGFHRYSISRGYNWTAPDTWNTASHRGGLTFDFEWSGDINWGGNDKAVRVIEWNETYTTIVGGLKLARSGGLVVWLRGGGAEYRLTSERGQYAGVQVKINGFTDASGENFPARSSPVASEVYGSYPVRGTGALYEYGHRVITANTIGNYGVATHGTRNGAQYTKIGDFYFSRGSTSFSGVSQGTITYPVTYANAPYVLLTVQADQRFMNVSTHIQTNTTKNATIVFGYNNGATSNYFQVIPGTITIHWQAIGQVW